MFNERRSGCAKGIFQQVQSHLSVPSANHYSTSHLEERPPIYWRHAPAAAAKVSVSITGVGATQASSFNSIRLLGELCVGFCCTLNIQRCANIYYLRTPIRLREGSAACMRVHRNEEIHLPRRRSRNIGEPAAVWCRVR